MATESMDIDMEDIDLDLDFDPEIARMQAEAAALNALPSATAGDTTDTADAMNGVDGVEEGEIGPGDIAGNKIHITGLEELTSQDLQNFVHDNHKGEAYRRIEWIDDTSANVVYHTDSAAAAALLALSAATADDPLEFRRAVTLTTHPHVDLYVRMAKVTDAKEPGAAKRSRFYLLHPEHDPENRPKRRRFEGPRRDTYRRGGLHDDHASRRSSQDGDSFDVDLYDDTTAAQQAVRARRASQASGEDLFSDRRNGGRSRRRGEDLFANRQQDRLRDRSASPAREGDGRYGFSDDQPYRRTARRRSPLRSRSNQDNYGARTNVKRDLLHSKKTTSALKTDPMELFPPNSVSHATELFPDKVSHRRQDAKDLHPDEVANAIGRRPENARDRNANGKPRDLFARIDKEPDKPRDLFARIGGGTGTAMNATAGRLSERPASEGNTGGGFSIKGAGKDAGFSFKGASKDNPLVKELFPTRAGSGVDLFAGKVKARGAPRRKAEDTF